MRDSFIEEYNFLKWVFLILLLITSIMHFELSLESAEQSSELSSGISEEIIETIEEITEKEIDHTVAHGVIRKLVGHFLWFSLIGIFGYFTFRFFFYKKYYLGLILACITGFIIALISELCQLVSSGRSCEFNDVMINTCGYLVSIVVFCLIRFLLTYKKVNKS